MTAETQKVDATPQLTQSAAASTQARSIQVHPQHNTEALSAEIVKEEKHSDDKDEAFSTTSLRRSSRVSGLTAQKKLIDMVDSQVETGDGVNGHSGGIEQSAATNPMADGHLANKRKRQLSEVDDLDQYDCKFGIRLDSHGDVVLMTDESEISSLNEEQVLDLRKKYDLSQAHILSEEVKMHREEQIKELEAELRLEEAKLSMLRKIRQNQQQTQLRNHQENTKKLPASVHQNQNSGNHTFAYKPPVAGVNTQNNNNSSKVNGTSKTSSRGTSKTSTNANNLANTNVAATLASLANSSNPQHQHIFQTLLAKLGNNPAQLQQLLQSLQNPANNISALMQQQQQQQNAARQQQQNTSRDNSSSTTTQSNASVQSVAEIAAKAKEIAYNNQQRITTARLAMRRALEQQILQLTTPKAPVQDLSFIPNGNQPDFCALLGLDLTVQRVLKDKAVFKKVDFSPYICEECGTDYTPSWKAICGEKGDYHLYCEHCVRQAQKRKVRQDQTALLKRAFLKVQEQEKEFEKQVAAGKFSDPIPTVPTPAAPVATTNNSSNSLVTASANAMNLSLTPSKQQGAPHHSSAHQLTSGSTTSHQAQQQQQNASGNRTGNAAGSSNHSTTPRSQPSARPPKRPAQTNASSTNASSSSNVATLAALQNNPMLQQQLVAMRAISQLSGQMNMGNMNPQMLAAAMMSQNSNPMVMQQFWNQMSQAMSQRSAPQTTQASNNSNSSNSNNNAGMAALLQAVQQSSQQNNSSSSSVPPTSNTSNSNTSSGMNPMIAASLNAQLSQMGAANFINNPQLLRQFQQAHLAQQMREMANKGNKK